jgi:hypothetical protein
MQALQYIKNVPSYAVHPELVEQKCINVTESNNIKYKYPVLSNKMLNWTDDKGTPFNYKMSIGMFDIKGYIVNGYTIAIIILGIVFGLFGHPLIGAFLGYHLLEALCFGVQKLFIRKSF